MDIDYKYKDKCGMRKGVKYESGRLCRNSNWVIKNGKYEATF